MLIPSRSPGALLLAGVVLALPRVAAALPSPGAPLSIPLTTAPELTNTLTLRVQLTCEGFACGFAGFGSPYDQTRVSTLTGTGNARVDDAGNTVRLSSDAGGTAGLLHFTGSPVTFTGIPTLPAVTTTSLTVDATNAPAASVPSMNLSTLPEGTLGSYSLAFAGMSIGALAVTDNATVGTLSIPATPISVMGTLVELGDTDADQKPELLFQNLRGESLQAVPEPGSFLLLAGGLVGLGAASRRRC